MKNNVLCDNTQRIWFLSATEPGRVHDKAIADAYPITLPKGSVLRQDLGLLGHAPADVRIEMPHKKPRKKELTFTQRLYNQMIASVRVVVEHAISGVKRLRMIKDTLRIQSADFRDQLMVVACGLHNLRVSSPFRQGLGHERVTKSNPAE